MSILKFTTLTLTCIAFLPTVAAADWTGLYVGGSVGSASNLSYDITTDINPDVDFENATSIGGFAGTRIETNGVVFGGEFAIETISDAEEFDGSVSLGSLLDLKVTAGRSLGVSALAYGIVSVSAASGAYGPNDINAGGLSTPVVSALVLVRPTC